MKVIAINGSPRKGGNTATMLKMMTDELEKEGIGVETIHVGNEKIRGCLSCWHCIKAGECVIKDDIVNETAGKLVDSDGFILASPTYFGGIAGTMKAFLDRAFFSKRASLRYKVATTLAVVRRTGGQDVQHQLANYLQLAETIIPPANYWTVVYGSNPGETLQDGEGVQTVVQNAKSMAWLLKVLEAGKDIPRPADVEKIMTNFIR